MKKGIKYGNFVKFIGYASLLSAFIVISDIIYLKLFERLPPTADSVYMQSFEPSIHQHSDIDGLFYELKPGSKSPLEFPGFFYEINSLGTRGRLPSTVKDSYRIIVIGDSVVFGPHVRSEERFTDVAEKMLNSEGKKAEIINISVSCYNTKQEYIALKEKYLFLKPDLVIFAFCANDRGVAAIQYLPDDRIQNIILKQGARYEGSNYINLSGIQYLTLILPNQFLLPYKADRWLFLHSGIYRALSLSTFKNKYNLDDLWGLSNLLLAFDFNEVVQDIKKLSIENGFTLRFMILPTLGKWDPDPVLTALTENDIEFWNFYTRDFEKKMDKTCFFPNGLAHFNSKGHSVLGKALAEKLDKIIP